jgi:beta-glucosidase
MKAGTTVALIGPSADDAGVILGNYQGIPGISITVRTGLQAVLSAAGMQMTYSAGCNGQECADNKGFAAAITAAAAASAIVFVGGTDQNLSKEGHDWDTDSACNGVAVAPGYLPGCQLPLLQALRSQYPGTPLIVVGMGGNHLYQPWELANASALLFSAYPGNMGGQALAEVLTGYNPGGRLPFTIPSVIPDIKLLADNDFTAGPGIGYRWIKNRSAVMHPFGYGLSYTTFTYSGLTLTGVDSSNSLTPCIALTVSVNVTNTGAVTGDEVVQAYISYPSGWDSTYMVPNLTLRGFERVTLPPGTTTTVTMTLPVDSTTVVDSQGFRQYLTGQFIVHVGGQQPGYASMGPGKSTGAPEPLATPSSSRVPMQCRSCPARALHNKWKCL